MRSTRISMVLVASVLMEYCAVISGDSAAKSRRSRTNRESGASFMVVCPREISKSALNAGLAGMASSALLMTRWSSCPGVQTFM